MQVDGGDHRPGQAVFVTKTWDLRSFPGTPQPDAADRWFPMLAPLLVERMLTKDRLRGIHQTLQLTCAVATGQILVNGSPRDVVGWSQLGAEQTFTPDQTMAIADAGVESKGIAAQLLIEGVDELTCFLGSDVAATEIGHGALPIRLAEDHQVASEGDIRGL